MEGLHKENAEGNAVVTELRFSSLEEMRDSLVLGQLYLREGWNEPLRYLGNAEVTTLDTVQAEFAVRGHRYTYGATLRSPFVHIPTEEPAPAPQPLEQPTLRDQFAMAALPALIAVSAWDKAGTAYAIADEMLKARESSPSPTAEVGTL